MLLSGRYALQTELSHEVPDCVPALGVAPWEPADLPHRRATPRAAVLLVPHDQRASVVD